MLEMFLERGEEEPSCFESRDALIGRKAEVQTHDIKAPIFSWNE
jgi:hypothetical protein